MPEESGAGAAYLAALKQSAVPESTPGKPVYAPAAPHAARSGGGVGAIATAPPNVEKRRSPRYRCQGSVHLRESTSDVASWATTTDISMHGCYVEASSGYRVGVAIALAIEINGFRFETKGVVRVSYPGLGMGIAFTQMADADRRQLRQLIASISQRSVVLGARAATQSSVLPESGDVPAITNAVTAVQAMKHFFEDRIMMSREEFLRILRKTQTPEP